MTAGRVSRVGRVSRTGPHGPFRFARERRPAGPEPVFQFDQQNVWLPQEQESAFQLQFGLRYRF